MIDHGDPVGLSGVQFGKHAEGVNHRHDHEYDLHLLPIIKMKTKFETIMCE